jgi:predicted metal-dependent enzyme (double-stranded beta helix superfamily)
MGFSLARSALSLDASDVNLIELAAILDQKTDRVGLLSELKSYVSSLGPEKIGAHSKETATHFVWTIDTNPSTGAKLCLHQFKNSDVAGSGYANTIHNHRYDFLTYLLTGGYVEEVYDLNASSLTLRETLTDIPTPRAVRQREGTIRVIHSGSFHRVRDVEAGTITLVLKAPPQSRWSVSVDLETGCVVTHHSLNDRVISLFSALGIESMPLQRTAGHD